MDEHGREQVTGIYLRQVDTVYRVCYLYVKNAQDAADLTQSTFLRLLQSAPAFQNAAHEKAWLIVTAGNLCKDFLRHWWRRVGPLEEAEGAAVPQEPGSEAEQVREQLMALPEKYRLPLYLFYYEGYSTGEIAGLLHKKEATVRSLLHRGRSRLRDGYEG